jgi:SAM-dependent methyltransferase
VSSIRSGHTGLHDLRFCPENLYLPCGYVQRKSPEYFSDDAEDGVVWQPDVYARVGELVAAQRKHVVIDLGCGRAGKLASLATDHPDWQFIGVDYGANLAWCASNLGFGDWFEADLESDRALPIDYHQAADAIVVCSDVLEHLVRPDVAIEHIRRLLVAGAWRAVLSTPAREQRAGFDHPGPPANKAHVREWASSEFHAFVRTAGLIVDESSLTRSDDSGGGMTTQLVVVSLPEPIRSSEAAP